jgi:crossover junction endodeoxyribonuclease RuvC
VRVLGIDPGSRFMGYGVVESQGGRLVHVGHGVIRGDPNADLATRLAGIFGELTQLFALLRPEVVAVEGVFTFKNVRSALILGHARGIALLAAAQHGLAVHEYAPAQVKRSVGAGGASGKDAVAKAVRTFLGAFEFERADASDALAVAICHLNQARVVIPRAGKKTGFADRLSANYVRAEAAK